MFGSFVQRRSLYVNKVHSVVLEAQTLPPTQQLPPVVEEFHVTKSIKSKLDEVTAYSSITISKDIVELQKPAPIVVNKPLKDIRSRQSLSLLADDLYNSLLNGNEYHTYKEANLTKTQIDSILKIQVYQYFFNSDFGEALVAFLKVEMYILDCKTS
jgi:hypothetical protein